MVSSNKILTVSYGTFSCTAEGFEDPLAVVKETTQFFRGVVGEDRFFGAEPPQVDPELASELMRQQITADAGGGQLTLRGPLAAGAASAGALNAALAAGSARPAAAAPADLPDDDTIEATAQYIERDGADAELSEAAMDMADDEDIEDAAAPASTLSESVASKLQRIRAVVEDNAEEAAGEPDLAPLLDDPIEADAEVEIDSILGALSDEDDADDAGDDLSALLGTEADDDIDAGYDDADEDADDAILNAASLQSPTAVLLSDDADEDELDLSSLHAALEAAPEADRPESAAQPVAAAYEDDEDDLEGLDADDFGHNDEDNADLYAATGAAVAAAGAVAADAFDDDDEDDLDDEWEGFSESGSPRAAAPAETDIDDDDFDDDVFEDDLDDEFAEAEAELPKPAAPVAAPAPAPARARVVKVKRAVFEQAVSSGQLEEVDEDEPTETLRVPGAESSSLSRDEEDELARELAAVKAELSGALDDEDWDDDDDDWDEP